MHSSLRIIRFIHASKFPHPHYWRIQVHTFSSFAPAPLAHSSSRTRFIHPFKLMHPHCLRIQVHALASLFTGTFKSMHRSTRAFKSCIHIIRGTFTRSSLHALHTDACSSLTRAPQTCMLITHTRLTHMHAHYSSCTQLMHSHALHGHAHHPPLHAPSQASITRIHPSPTHSAHSRVTVHSSRSNYASHDATHPSASHTAAFTFHFTPKTSTFIHHSAHTHELAQV